MYAKILIILQLQLMLAHIKKSFKLLDQRRLCPTFIPKYTNLCQGAPIYNMAQIGTFSKALIHSSRQLSYKTAYNFSQFHSNNKEYEDSKPEQQKKVDNSSKESQENNNVKIEKDHLRILQRLRQYGQFLAKKDNRKVGSTIVGINAMEQEMISKIDQHFKQAGTNAQEISQSLIQISNKLETMLKQSQSLYNANKNSQDSKKAQKYKSRFVQFLKLLKKLDQHQFAEPKVTKIQPIQAALFLLDMQTQLTSLIQLLYGAIADQASPHFKFTQDIASDDPFSKNFQYAWKKVKLIELDPQTKKNHDMVYGLLRKSVVMVTNAVVTEHTFSDWDNQYWHKILFGLSFPVSLINLQKAQLKCYKLWRKPNIQMVKHLLDLPEKGYIQHAKKIIYPSIKSNFFLYRHSAAKSTIQNKQSVKSNQVNAQETSSNIFQRSDNSGRILLLSHTNIDWKGVAKPVQKFSFIKNLFNRSKKQKNEHISQQKQTCIIHIHGGGFISMSSQLMQNHTRKWANELEVPVFSLDYRKPPLHRFPEPLQDCVAGYKFIVQKINQYANIKPKNIIIAGDSAGGNMACALQAQLMKEKYPVLPKALFLMYPAVDLRIRYTPSRLNSFTDGIFLPSLLMLCQQEYLGKDRKNQFDPLASPILLTQEYINPQKKDTAERQKWPINWPKTVIMAGRKDPLFDDSIRLLERLTKDGHDCKMLLYKDFSHGFMSMDQALPGCKQAIEDSIKQMRQLIKSF